MQKMETGCGFEQAVTVFRIHTLMKQSILFVPTVLFQGLCFFYSGRKVLHTDHCSAWSNFQIFQIRSMHHFGLVS